MGGGGKMLKQLMARLHLLATRQHSMEAWRGRGVWVVPRGHFVVYVGEARARFVVPTVYLKQPPAFVALLEEDYFGFDHHCHPGGLTIYPFLLRAELRSPRTEPRLIKK